MGMLLAFAPFIAFAIIDRLTGSFSGLCAGALISLSLVARDWLAPSRHTKILETGTCLLFVSLSIYAWLVQPDWSVIAVRLFVDAGLFVVVIVSILVGQPFSMQYARDTVPQKYWDLPQFKRTNYVISGVWALAFFAMVLAELALLFLPSMPHRLGVIIIIIALVGAFKFTGWYPTRHGQPIA